MFIEIQYDGEGSHRVCVNDQPGEWARYTIPAFSRDKTVMHLTDFFGEQVFTNLTPTKEFSVRELESDEIDTWMNNGSTWIKVQ